MMGKTQVAGLIHKKSNHGSRGSGEKKERRNSNIRRSGFRFAQVFNERSSSSDFLGTCFEDLSNFVKIVISVTIRVYCIHTRTNNNDNSGR